MASSYKRDIVNFSPMLTYAARGLRKSEKKIFLVINWVIASHKYFHLLASYFIFTWLTMFRILKAFSIDLSPSTPAIINFIQKKKVFNPSVHADLWSSHFSRILKLLIDLFSCSSIIASFLAWSSHDCRAKFMRHLAFDWEELEWLRQLN
jgi:hypothetical protein